MGFWNGRLTFTRFRVQGQTPLPLGEELLEQAREHRIGLHGGGRGADGVATGWAGGDHVLDTTIDYAKNIVDDAVHLAVRVDADKIPGSLLKAYTQMEIDAVAQLNPSGTATKAQKAEAKEAAKLRLEAEAADGRFQRMSHTPVLWDAREGIVYVGATTGSILERAIGLFRETFNLPLEPITAGELARATAQAAGVDADRAVAMLEGAPLRLVGSSGASNVVAWNEENPSSLDSLGNEFLVWAWHRLQIDGDTIPLSDGSEIALMLARTLTLDCPRGETGRDQLTDGSPTRLPEALRALQSGKLPRKAGLIMARQGSQYELTLQAETLAVSNASLPKAEGKLAPHESRIHRLESLRHLAQTLDLLFAAYLSRRMSSAWSDELGRIESWLRAA